MGKVTTNPLPPQGSPPLESGGQNQKWPTSGQGGYVTPAASGIPSASERRATSEVAHFWGGGYKTPDASGILTAPDWGAKSEVAHLWARWLRNPCRLGDPLRFRAGGKIRSGTLVGNVATLPLPPRGSQPLHSGRQNQKWPTCGQRGYKSPAASGILAASERRAKSELAHLWARWLRNRCRLGDLLCFEAGCKIRGAPLVGKVATKPLTPRGSSPLKSGGQHQKWPTCGQGGYVTHAASGIPSASEQGTKSKLAHLWARWLRNPCPLGDPQHFGAGGSIKSGPLVDQVAT